MLRDPASGGIMICPESGLRYQLTTGDQQSEALKCLDVDENAPLSQEMSVGQKCYDAFKDV